MRSARNPVSQRRRGLPHRGGSNADSVVSVVIKFQAGESGNLEAPPQFLYHTPVGYKQGILPNFAELC